MALGIVNELHAVSGGEVDPYRYYRVSTVLYGSEVVVAHVAPYVDDGSGAPQLWVFTYEGYPWNDSDRFKHGDKLELRFELVDGTSAVTKDRLLSDKFGRDTSNVPYTHVAYPLSTGIVVHDGR